MSLVNSGATLIGGGGGGGRGRGILEKYFFDKFAKLTMNVWLPVLCCQLSQLILSPIAG